MSEQCFVSALSTLLLSKETHTDTDVTARTPAALRTLLQSIQFVFVPHITTKFVLTYTTTRGTERIEFVDTTARERLCYHNKATSKQELYINTTLASSPPLTLHLAVATGVCQKIGADLSLAYAVAALMAAEGEGNMGMVLESLHVHLDHR